MINNPLQKKMFAVVVLSILQYMYVILQSLQTVWLIVYSSFILWFYDLKWTDNCRLC